MPFGGTSLQRVGRGVSLHAASHFTVMRRRSALCGPLWDATWSRSRDPRHQSSVVRNLVTDRHRVRVKISDTTTTIPRPRQTLGPPNPPLRDVHGCPLRVGAIFSNAI